MYCYKFCSTVFADPSGREARGKDWQKPCWGVFDWQAQGLQVLSANSGDFFTSRLTDFQVKTCNAILEKYRLMLRSVLKEGFRGGRAATVENLTEQFCQKVELSQLCDSIVSIPGPWSTHVVIFFYRAQKPAKTGRCQHSSKRGRGRSRRREARPTRGRRSPIGGSGPVAVGSQSCKKSLLYSDFLDMFALASQ